MKFGILVGIWKEIFILAYKEGVVFFHTYDGGGLTLFLNDPHPPPLPIDCYYTNIP